MTNEEQTIAIAEACGWKYPCWACAAQGMTHTWRRPTDDGCVERSQLPDYPNDLNAMHEAEKAITDWRKYSDWLMRIVQVADIALYNDSVGARYRTAGATAAQKAEAFLCYFGLWKTDEADMRPNTKVCGGGRNDHEKR